MIKIVKGQGPDSLQEHAAKGYHYDEHARFARIKQEIREHLCEEQGYICCFCMRRIKANRDSIQVAHIHNQAEFSALDCKFSNMLGSCADPKTCNQAQKNRDLKFSPSDLWHNIEDKILYDTDGTIHSIDSEFEKQITCWLDLNQYLLRRNREEIYKRIRLLWRNAKNFQNKQDELRKNFEFWQSSTSGKKQEYCGVALYFIRQKLR